MKKVLVLLLILFFVSGCLGSLGNTQQPPDVAYKRGIDINFKTSENQPPMQIGVNRDFYVSFDVINYAKYELSGNILIYDNWGEEYGNVQDGTSLSLEGESGFIGKKQTVSFGPFRYTDKKLANKNSNIIAEADVDNYPVEIDSSVRVKKSGSSMSSNLLLQAGMLGREASNAPITIDKIEVNQINLPNTNDVNLDLIIYFKNYGGQINNDDKKIENFNIDLIGGNSFDCKSYNEKDKFLVFKDKKDATIICSTSVDLGEQEYRDYPLKIKFSYPYKISKEISIKII
ncbi:MAG: hypothetical protein NT139_02660 [Candidatus Woesearchaeota archaeon]|nr:hypothetical protein [Candidatus Woesearchaeota archaeon]